MRKSRGRRLAIILRKEIFPKGGEAYADYSDISCVRNYRYTEIDEEKQQPPLGKVTVVEE